LSVASGLAPNQRIGHNLDLIAQSADSRNRIGAKRLFTRQAGQKLGILTMRIARHVTVNASIKNVNGGHARVYITKWVGLSTLQALQ
jgi:hypothetical protein